MRFFLSRMPWERLFSKDWSTPMQILLKRAYDKPVRDDGFRVLVDRLWPRGVKKVDLHLDTWAKDLAPSSTLRLWFGHDEKRWIEFRRRYKHELADPVARRMMKAIIYEAKDAQTITLVYAARDIKHNEAVVLRDELRRLVG